MTSRKKKRTLKHKKDKWKRKAIEKIRSKKTVKQAACFDEEVKQRIEVIIDGEATRLTYDQALLERARTQWQFGDWTSLSKLGYDTIQHHPDGAKLALLVAASHFQIGQICKAKQYIAVAQERGVSKKVISQILAAGVYNSIGRASALAGYHSRALTHFESAVGVGMPESDARLVAQARCGYQLRQVGIELQSNGKFHFNPLLERASLSEQTNNSAQSKRLRDNSAARAEYLNKNGELLYQAGQFKLAAEYFRRGLDLTPKNAWICQNLAEAAARMDFKKGEQWECDQLGERLDETGQWDVVVRYYRRALKLDPAVVKQHQKEQVFAVEPARPEHIDNPIFIVGCGHSGTSLMLAILGNHPSIHPIPKESGLFLRPDIAVQDVMRGWDAECITQNKKRWVEKTPPHVFQMHRFLALRPKAQFVVMLRDGRDVVCSLKSRAGYDRFEDRLDRWVYDNLASLPYWEHPQVKVVKYEDLVQDPEATLRNVCQFLGEDYMSEMLEYHKVERHWYSDQIIKPDEIKTHSDHLNNRNWQINQPIFDGRGRWAKEMSEVEKDRFKHSLAQRYLEQFGYVTDTNWLRMDARPKMAVGISGLRVDRFTSNPLITLASSRTLGDNVNGPSVIRVPAWLPNPLGKYYMYFAHHSGTFIRLAYANELWGPWYIYEPGSLKLKDAAAFRDHIASPDVHVDDSAQQIRMYFHGVANDRQGQWTGVATSSNGLDFMASNRLLGQFYFRVWHWGGRWYAVAKNGNEGWGQLYRSDDPMMPFQSRGNFLKDMRHAAVWPKGHELWVFYSRVGDAPERILRCKVDMRSDWLMWMPTEPTEVLEPEYDYEGAPYEVKASQHGPATRVRQLRDPFYFEESGAGYLFYSASGEEVICGARIEGE